MHFPAGTIFSFIFVWTEKEDFVQTAQGRALSNDQSGEKIGKTKRERAGINEPIECFYAIFFEACFTGKDRRQVLQNISLDRSFLFLSFHVFFFFQQELVADISVSITKLFAPQCTFKKRKSLMCLIYFLIIMFLCA